MAWCKQTIRVLFVQFAWETQRNQIFFCWKLHNKDEQIKCHITTGSLDWIWIMVLPFLKLCHSAEQVRKKEKKIPRRSRIEYKQMKWVQSNNNTINVKQEKREMCLQKERRRFFCMLVVCFKNNESDLFFVPSSILIWAKTKPKKTSSTTYRMRKKHIGRYSSSKDDADDAERRKKANKTN